MDLRTKLSLDGSDFGKTLEDAGKQVGDFQKKTDDASKSVDEMGKATSRSASELLKEMKGMENLGRSTNAYRQQLSQITQQITDLTINYRNMSEEMKNSDFGREVAAKIEELTVKAGEYKDAIIDAQQSVKALASDTAGWDAMKQGIEGVSAGLQLFVATGVLGKQSTEKLVAVLAKLKAMEAATNAVIKIGNLLQKQSALMMGVAKVQALALTKAKNLETAATGKATIAQKIFNAVAKANPYVLLATAVVAVVGALAAFAAASDKAKKKEEELQKKTERAKEAFEDFRNKVGNAVGDVVGKFNVLQREFTKLTSDTDKKKWVDNNAAAFKELGLKIDDVNSAEEVLVNHADDVIAALIAQAEAMAMLDLWQEHFKKQTLESIDAQKEFNDALANPQNKAGGRSTGVIPQLWKDAGLTAANGGFTSGVTSKAGPSGFLVYNWYELTEQGAQQLYDYLKRRSEERQADVKAEGELLRSQLDAAEHKAAETAAKVSGLYDPNLNKNNSNTPVPTTQEVELKYTKGSYAEAQAIINQLQTDLNNMSFDDPAFGLVVAALDQWKQRAQEIKDAMALVNAEVKKTPGSYAEAAAMVSMLSRELQNLDPNSEEFRNVHFELESWTEELNRIKSLMEVTKEEVQELAKVDPFAQWKEGLSIVGSFESSFSSIYSSVKNIGDAFKDCEDPLEALFTTVDNVLSILNNITSVLELINTLEQISVATALAKQIADKGDTQEKIKQTIINSTNLSIEQAEAIASSVKAAADAGSSAAKIPVVGWVLAIGAIAAIMAAIASAKSSVNFANGGIVPGTSFSGDRIQANLNSGEMVLNTQQQRNLFNMLDGKAAGYNGGKVEFVIKGQELKGVLNNYDKKMSRI